MNPKGRQGGLSGARPRNAKATLIRLLTYLNGHRVTTCLAIVLVIVGTVFSLMADVMLMPTIDSLTASQDRSQLAYDLTRMALRYIISVTASFVSLRLFLKTGEYAVNRIRADLFAHCQRLPVHRFDTKRLGDTMSVYTNDADLVATAIENAFGNLMTSVFLFVGSLIMMLLISPLMTAIVLAVTSLTMAAVFVLSRVAATSFRRRQKALGVLNGFVEEQVHGQRVIHMYGREEETLATFSGHNEAARREGERAIVLSTISFPLVANLAIVQYAILALIGATLAINGHAGITLGMLTLFLQFSRKIGRPINTFSQNIGTVLGALAGAERIFALLDEPIEVDDGTITWTQTDAGDAATAKWVDTCDPAWTPRPVKGDVAFHRVSFAYDDGPLVLHDVSFSAPAGTRTALVGATGAGKTTIIQLLTRFYETTEGEITIDGIDIRRIKKESLRRLLGLVLQDVHLFTDTIRDNVRFGRITASDLEVEEAACAASADGFIRALARGYETVLNQDGGRLSNGQRQLLSIARATLAEPRLLILDEATSSIDTRTERQISQAMNDLMANRTTLVIAHRLSTVRNADTIVVLDHGHIVEQGSHDALIALRGRYYALCSGLETLA